MPWFSRLARAGLAANGEKPSERKCRQSVFHQPDVHAAGPHRPGILIACAGCVSQGHCVQSVDGNLMFCNQVALDRFSQALGALDAGAAGLGRMRLHLQNVAVPAGDAGRQVVELLAGLSRQRRLSTAESDIGFRDLVVLVQAVHGSVQLVYMAGRTLRRSACLLGLCAGGGCCLVGRARPSTSWMSLAFLAFTSSSSLSRSLMGSVCLLTHFLRAKGFTRPQKPSFEALVDGEAAGCCCAAEGGVF